MNYGGRHRRSVRLSNYDYAKSGAYFVTICTANREPVFGQVVNGEMRLSGWGAIAADELLRGPELHPNLEMDAFVVMPNHIHAIWVIADDTANGRGTMHRAPAKPWRRFGQSVAGSLSTFVGLYKAAVTRCVHRRPGCGHAVVWQSNYHEHIIRSPEEMQRIQQYVMDNPARWNEDTYHMP